MAFQKISSEDDLLDGLTVEELGNLNQFLTDLKTPRLDDKLSELSLPYENIETEKIKVDERFAELFFLTKGGRNRIFTAFDMKEKTDVVIRIPNKNIEGAKLLFAIERYGQEYNLLRKLKKHGVDEVPNPIMIDTAYVGENEISCSYLVINFVEGVNFSDLILAESIDSDELKNIFLRICETMNKVHDINLIHRDLKPQNMIIDSENKISIIDWETAVDLSNISDLENWSGSVGTLGYCPPEKVNGITGFSKSEDIYALGATLFMMSTQKNVFDNLDRDIIFEIHRNYEEPPLLKNINEFVADRNLINVIKRAMHTDPKKRYSDINEMIEDFKKCL